MKPIVCALAFAFGAIIATPSTAQQAQSPPNEPAHKIFVVTGCLTGGGPAETAIFKLTGAVPVGQGPPERSAASPDAKDVYELLPTTGLIEQGIARAELLTHVGKKVQATIRPVEVAPGPGSSSSTPATTAKVEETAPQRYTVSTIKSLGDTCL